MKHNDIKNLLFTNPEIKVEYDKLEPFYEKTRETIRIVSKNELVQNELVEPVGINN